MAKIKMPTQQDVMGMWQASGLKEKLIFTLLIIAVFRFGAQIPIFGINADAFKAALGALPILGFLDLFTGGALGRVSIFALGIGPYITASIIMQLMGVVIPHLESLQKEEGEAGRRKLSQYTRVFTLILALFQSSVFMTLMLKNPSLILPGVSIPLFFAGGIITLTAGAIFIMWLAELVTERGIGNGGSLLIFAGIISGIPLYAADTSKLVSQNSAMLFPLVILLTIFFATIIFIVIMQEAIRKVVIVNAKKQVGNKVYGGANTHIPFKLNPGGVMPIIFAVAILLFPATLLNIIGEANLAAGFFKDTVDFLKIHVLSPGSPVYYGIYFLLIVGLTFFYASIMPNMQPKEIANNLKKYGSSIPGIKPGKPTADALDIILSRITFIGAMGLGLIALIPGLASSFTGITTLQGIGSTSLIIMVGVALDLINQIRTHLLARQYEGFFETMKLEFLLMGPPACGKGTQTKKLARHLNIPHIDTGGMLRAVIASGSEAGKRAKQNIDKGQLVPLDIVKEIINDRLHKSDCAQGFILDGYPRSPEQAEILEDILLDINKENDYKLFVINLDVDEKILIERIVNRRMCKNCGKIYNMKFFPTKEENKCDACASELMQRDDDTYETAVKRLETYHRQTEPLIKYYLDKNILVNIDGNKSIDEIFAKILESVEK